MILVPQRRIVFQNPILAAELGQLEAATKTKASSFSAESGKVKVPPPG